MNHRYTNKENYIPFICKCDIKNGLAIGQSSLCPRNHAAQTNNCRLILVTQLQLRLLPDIAVLSKTMHAYITRIKSTLRGVDYAEIYFTFY